MPKHEEEYPAPTPTQEELNRIKSGEVGVTDTADDVADEATKPAKKDVEAGDAAAYKTRQAKAD